MHNGWLRDTEDDSSRVTGSTVFDFNGDNAAEIVYNDECYFRIYNGIDGQVFFKEPSESRTRIEYPVVADVDNDGNAEIVFTTSNESRFCSERANNDPSTSQPLFNRFNNGLEVWGDDSDLWVSARRIWNQHTYHVTNVLESGAIPAREPANWRAYNGRTYNTYRSQPRAFGVAPDLQLVQVQVSSPDASCGQLSELLNIAARVANRGDLRVGPGVTVSFIGVWGTEREPLLDAAGQPLTFTLQTSLEPGAATVVNAPYAASQNAFGRLPDRVEVVIDASGRERECNEDNNTASVAVAGGSLQPDLRVSVDDIDLGLCFSEGVTISGVVTNDGSATATDIRVRLYAGNPEQGGTELFEYTVPTDINAGGSAHHRPQPDPVRHRDLRRRRPRQRRPRVQRRRQHRQQRRPRQLPNQLNAPRPLTPAPPAPSRAGRARGGSALTPLAPSEREGCRRQAAGSAPVVGSSGGGFLGGVFAPSFEKFVGFASAKDQSELGVLLFAEGVVGELGVEDGEAHGGEAAFGIVVSGFGALEGLLFGGELGFVGGAQGMVCGVLTQAR